MLPNRGKSAQSGPAPAIPHAHGRRLKVEGHARRRGQLADIDPGEEILTIVELEPAVLALGDG
jgi:hypothetical protein